MARTTIGNFKIANGIINGNFDFWQRSPGVAVSKSGANISTFYVADRFGSGSSGTTATPMIINRSTDVPSYAQSGFNSVYSFLFTNNSAIGTALVNGDSINPLNYNMEGLDYQQFHGKQVTISFWFKASIGGTYSFNLRNHGSSRSYVSTFTATAATWELKTFTVQLDTTGTWLFDNANVGLRILIGALAGPSTTTATLNQWQAATLVSASTSTNWAATNGATIQFAQLSIVEGPNYLGFQRSANSVADELVRCQRYFEKSYELETVPGTASSTIGRIFSQAAGTSSIYQLFFKASKRAIPTVALYSPVSGTLARWLDGSTSTDRVVAALSPGVFSSGVDCSTFPSLNSFQGYFAADAEF